MKYMEITEGIFEIDVRVYSEHSSTMYIKHFHMRGTDNTVESVLEFCCDMSDKYGVDEIRIIGVGGHAYEHMKSYTARRSRYMVVNRYNISKLG